MNEQIDALQSENNRQMSTRLHDLENAHQAALAMKDNELGQKHRELGSLRDELGGLRGNLEAERLVSQRT